jgi:hypothetical protein
MPLSRTNDNLTGMWKLISCNDLGRQHTAKTSDRMLRQIILVAKFWREYAWWVALYSMTPSVAPLGRLIEFTSASLVPGLGPLDICTSVRSRRVPG